jgi:hypothetical protein
MNDDRLTTALGSFYKGTAPTPPDPELGLERVMTRVRKTRQRGRWWPLPIFGRAPAMPSAIPDPEYRSTPIPATNGHSPTVTRRTQTMFSPVKAITAGALVFALGGVLLIAQPFDQRGGSVPGAATDAEAEWAAVTGSSACGLGTPGVETDGPPYSLTNQIMRCTDSSTDPRVSGPSTVVINVEGWDTREGNNAVAWFDYTIEGPEGDWVGHTYGLYDDEGLLHLVGVLAGNGAYEGLTFTVAGTVPAGRSTLTYDGLIQPGSPPPGFPVAPLPESASE